MDGLTGRPNHLELRKTPPATDMPAAFFDIDGLVWVNDYHGFAEGDRAVIAVAQIVGHAAEKTGGRAYRVGGDEFLLLGARVDASVARSVTEAVHNLAIPYQRADLPSRNQLEVNAVTFSFTTTHVHESIGEHGLQEPLRRQLEEAIFRGRRSGAGVVVAL